MEYVPPVGGEADESYVNGTPAAGIRGSIPPAEAIEHPMREILAVIERAGLTPTAANLEQLADAIEAIIAGSGSFVPLTGTANLTGGYSMPPLDLGTDADGTVQLALAARNHQKVTVNHASAVFADPSDVATWPGGEVRLWLTMAAGAAFSGKGTNVLEREGSFADMEAGRKYTVDLTSPGDGKVRAYISLDEDA